MSKKVVAVIGGRECTPEVEKLAHNLGKKLAKVADALVCGGLSGVMEAICKGFSAGGGPACGGKRKRGLTIGILPSYEKSHANKHVDIAIPTGLGLARNVLVVKSADVVVALPGKAGTLSEIAYCLQFGIPVISLTPLEIQKEASLTTKFLTGLKSWDIPGVIKVKTVEKAIKEVKQRLKSC